MSNIPEDLVMDVLSRLRVKSLLRFRSVSKSWRTLIDSPSFIKIHMERSMKIGSTVEVIHRRNLKKFYSLHLDLSGNPVRDPEELPHPFGYRHDLEDSVVFEIHLVGSCNGVLCFVDSAHRIVLWNLATRKYFEIQYLRIEPPKFANLYYLVNYGFGYDCVTDDYKVIRLIITFNSESECYLVELYSLKSDSWTRFEDLVGHTRRDNHGILVSGALHWIRDDNESPIVAFDLTNEEFNTVPCPDLSGRHCWKNLGIVHGCLCFFCDDPLLHAELWVMKDHGIKESWTKVFTENKSPIHYMRPIDHSKSKITVVSEVNNKKLAWCNFEQKSITNNAPIRYIETICAVRSLEACANYDSLVGTSWKRYDGIARSSTKKS
ncbi:F-box protein CPR30 [Forsythia ovata]|uniref:F-box protein CPR30 n=1 Tax=Forsythia ovata TaxID=205694 RepID=A0ABD1NVX5_9LAMI